jgi:hypothetical protein
LLGLNSQKTIRATFLKLCASFCGLKKWGHYRIGRCVRPSVYTVIRQRIIRLWWNFVHRTVSLISRSSSKMRTIGPHLPELYQKMWLFLWAYSMEFLPKKTQVSPNRPKGILSCRAWKVVFVVKKSAINIVPLGRYRSHNFSWKSWKFAKNRKIFKFCGLDFFHIIWSKMNSKYIFLFFMSSSIRPHASSYFAFVQKKNFGTHWWSLTEMIVLTISPYELR